MNAPMLVGIRRPKVVTLCGSTRFGEAFAKAALDETIGGNIVLSIGCNLRDADVFADYSENQLNLLKARLDELHKRKIDLSDEILVLNVGGYIGQSTMSEILYALETGKGIRYLEPDKVPEAIARLK